MKKTIFLETHNIQNRASGLGTFNYELIKGLHQHSFDNLELHLNSNKPSLLKSEFGEKFEYHKYFGFHRYKNLRPFNKFDLWHSVNQNSKIEPRFDTKYLLTIHDVNFFEEISSNMNHIRNQNFIEKLKRATAITYISEFAKKQTHNYFQVPNVPEHIIYNGNPISNLLNTSSYISNTPINKPFFYTIGDFIERKNYTSIIEMMKLIKDYNLIMSGNNDKEYGQVIKKLIRDNGLENQVFLTGKVSNEGKQFYIKNCEAFLFPSIREGFGLPPIEAMRFGKPVFLSDKTSLPEIGGEVANYWKNFDPDYMKEIVFEGLNNHENNKLIYEQKLIERALFFDWKKAAGEYLDVYNKCIY
ncbi:glycosyltransferase involved in cell wall biosynthesis [Flavobacterium sp. 1]|uniref:glycosyltransferase family 4 protein n=1 Tax=Flavobacterium sp. 1 TaxID=2035200 RepID=UPI000C24C0EE|nr:glycosyltransferase family 1 protein [Flavobacterium sp. 1]PJJ07196.1 glycosyltransferase involved in cell wall biosynthesis [Flavobacterium sp. 1]